MFANERIWSETLKSTFENFQRIRVVEYLTWFRSMFHVWQISEYLIWLKFTICLRWYSYLIFNIYFLLYISLVKHVCFIVDYVCLETESRSRQIGLSFVDITDQYVIRNYQTFIFIVIVTGFFEFYKEKHLRINLLMDIQYPQIETCIFFYSILMRVIQSCGHPISNRWRIAPS
jgi:hypothetical protein